MTLDAEIKKQAEWGFILEKIGKNFRQYFNVKNSGQHRRVMDSDPIDTFTITNDALDGHVVNAGTDYLTVHDATVGYYSTTLHNYVGQEFTSPYYWICRMLFRFDTSALPDAAVITATKLKLYVFIDRSDDDFVIRIQKWTEAPAISNNDYDAFDGINYDDGNFNTIDLNPTAYNDIIFSDFTVINKIGYTDLCIRSNKDISSTPPTREELVNFQDAIQANPPKLEVTWLLLDLCTWIADRGGPTGITSLNVYELIIAYTPPGTTIPGYNFIPTSLEIYGTLLYYNGENGDPFTGCDFFP